MGLLGLLGLLAVQWQPTTANHCQLLAAVGRPHHPVACCWHCWHTSCQQVPILRGDLQPANQTNICNILQHNLILTLLFLLMNTATNEENANLILIDSDQSDHWDLEDADVGDDDDSANGMSDDELEPFADAFEHSERATAKKAI